MRVCSLSEILNQILLLFYTPTRTYTEEETASMLATQDSALKKWKQDLPDFLQMSIDNLPKYCPPVHIAVLKYFCLVFQDVVWKMLT